MLDKFLKFIEKELNNYIKLKYNTTENKVVLTTASPSKNSSNDLDNVIVMTLINIEEDQVVKQAQYKVSPSGAYSRTNPPLNISTSILFSSFFNHENYIEGIQFISSILEFFQRNQHFSNSSHPEISDFTNKLTSELIPTDLEHLNLIWGPLGINYKPSLIYKFRFIQIHGDNI